MTNQLTDQEITRYARQMILPEIGDAGQDKLKASRLGIIGAGGLGTPALIMAATAGFGHISIMDDDVVEATNLNRQFLFTPQDEGASKAEIAARFAGMQNPHISITATNARFDEANADSFFADHDLIIDASDNPTTRQRANRASIATKKTLIFVSAIRFEGQLALFAPHLSDNNACYECLFPHQPEQGDVPNCATVGIAGPVTSVMGSLAVLEAMKWQTGNDKAQANQLILFDGLTGDLDKIKTKKSLTCRACSQK